MTGGRETILSAIRDGLGRGMLTGETKADLERRLRSPRSNRVPARGQRDQAGRADLFIAEAERVNATTERVERWEAVPVAVAHYLRTHNLPMTVRMATDPVLTSAPWEREPALAVGSGAAEAGDTTSVTSAFAGIAETGTLMLLSSPTSPTSLNFLPPNHIAVVGVDRVVGSYEDGWALLRAEVGVGIAMPRAINWITGPSRTADIEQTLLLGAHGPRALHIILVDGTAGV